MKIAFFDAIPEEYKYVADTLKRTDVFFSPKPLASSSIPDEALDSEVVSVFVHSRLTEDVIGALPKLKHIVARSTGYDHIDLAKAKERGVTVSNIPTYGARTVAEYAFALTLSLSRKAYAAYDRLRISGKSDVKDFEGFTLSGKTMGIIGTGHIGSCAIDIASGFDMNVIAFDAFPKKELAKEKGFQYVSLEELVSESDIVTIHVPLLESTRHLINKELFGKWKKGGILINTSRGEVVDTQALLDALQSGTLYGAGLDVLEGERLLSDETSLLSNDQNDVETFRTLIADHKLIDMPNVIVTPHIAFNTKEAKKEILDTALANMQAFIDGNPQNLV